MTKKRLIGEILLDEKKITELILKQALTIQETIYQHLGEILIDNNFISKKDLISALSIQFNLSTLDFSKQKLDKSLTKIIPAQFAYANNFAPIIKKDDTLTIAITDPLDISLFDNIALFAGCELEKILCSKTDLEKILKKLYGIGAETIEYLHDKNTNAGTLPTKLAIEDSSDNKEISIISFVNQIIKDAYYDRATDIHIEPFENEVIVRYRIDGVLHPISMPSSLQNFTTSIISRIKIMANMNIAENRLPQDGRIHFKVDNENIDLRVATLPTIYGESINLRILPRNQIFLNMKQLGLNETYFNNMEVLIKKSHGIILVTGPTGHGKTTTLYASLSKINSQDKKIITVEDPIEYRLRGVNQVPVHAKIGMTFANGLRSILRQDPDIIMVGEIRDKETAEIAIRSSLTGHLVFSTLHTNDAPGAITRLKDMGIESYLLASSLEAVLAQRLVRLVCPKCKAEDDKGKEYLRNLGKLTGQKIYKAGDGCEYCMHTGYKERTGIYELMILDDDMRQLIVNNSSKNELKDCAERNGMIILRDDGFNKVNLGITTIEEILRATN